MKLAHRRSQATVNRQNFGHAARTAPGARLEYHPQPSRHRDSQRGSCAGQCRDQRNHREQRRSQIHGASAEDAAPSAGSREPGPIPQHLDSSALARVRQLDGAGVENAIAFTQRVAKFSGSRFGPLKFKVRVPATHSVTRLVRPFIDATSRRTDACCDAVLPTLGRRPPQSEK